MVPVGEVSHDVLSALSYAVRSCVARLTAQYCNRAATMLGKPNSLPSIKKLL